MFKNDDLIEVYNDYDSTLYAPSVDVRGVDLVFPPKDIDDQPYVVSTPFIEIKNLYRLSPNVLKRRNIRVLNKEIETELFKQLGINLERENDVYTRDEIENMILHPNQFTIDTILEISSLDVINKFLSQLVYLKNSNRYFIVQKVEDYIRARKEEIEQGLRKTELEGSDTENLPVTTNTIDLAVIEEKEAELKAKEEELKAKEKALKEKAAKDKPKTTRTKK